MQIKHIYQAPSRKSVRYAFGLFGLAGVWLALPAQAQIADRYIGDIFMMAGAYCPQNSLPADGQSLRIGSNQALFSLIGTRFGGDGRAQFNLPDLRGRSPVGAGDANTADLTSVALGEAGGNETLALRAEHIPPHRHAANAAGQAGISHRHDGRAHHHRGTLRASANAPTSHDPDGRSLPTYPHGTNIYALGPPEGAAMASDTLSLSSHGAHDTDQMTLDTPTGPAGGTASVSARSPYLGVQFCIVVNGLYPARE